MDEKRPMGPPSGPGDGKRMGPPPGMGENPKTKPGWPGPEPEDVPVSAEYETEIVVIGGGHAGTQLALSAAEGGAKVIVLEQQPNIAKMHWSGEQIGTYNSSYFIERGYGPYDLMEIVQEYMRQGCHRVDQRIISLYVRNSGEMLDHALSLVPADSTLLNDDQVNIHGAYQKEYPVVLGGNKTWAGTLQVRGTIPTEYGARVGMNANSRLSELEQICVDRSIELGAQWLGGYQSYKLEKENGRVSAVIAKNTKTGEYIRVKASKAVCVTNGNNSDNGHKLCAWAGGQMETAVIDSYMPQDASPMFGMTCFLTLNRKGERFCNEADTYCLGPQIARQPRGTVTTVFDSNYIEYLKVNGIQHSMPDMNMPIFLEQQKEDITHVVAAGKEGYMVRNLSSSERQMGRLWGANTLDELADIMGYEGEDKARWLQSIARYNELCYKGVDEDFGKDAKAMIPIDKPPFYSAMVDNQKRRSTSDGMCPTGLLTNVQLNVLDADGDEIPGLYVAGNTLGGRYFLFYPTPCGGNMIGSAMTHGRVLGKILTGQDYVKA